MIEAPRILLLSEPVPPYHPGGAGKFALNMALSLAALDHHVTCLCVNTREDRLERHDNLDIHWLKVTEYGWDPRTFEERTERVVADVLRLHEENPFDLVHDCGGFLYADAFVDIIEKTGLAGISHLLLLMGPYLAEAGVPQDYIDYFNYQQKKQCTASRVVITTSRSESLFYRAIIPDGPDDMIVHNAVHVCRPTQDGHDAFARNIRQRHGDDILMFVGGKLDDVVKGGDRAIGLATALQERGIGCRLLTTSPADGNGAIGDLVVSLGRLDEEQLSATIAGCDLVLCPSRYEAFGLLAVEAAALGTPVIASQVGGHFDTVGQYGSGRLIDDNAWSAPDDELVAHITACRQPRQTREPVGVPKPFRFATLAPKLADIYRSAMN